MVFARAVGFAEPDRDLLLALLCRRNRLFTLDDRRIRFQPRPCRADRLSERALAIDQRLISQQELG